jgi:hypothetical protein
LWKKPTAHSQNILHVDVLYNIKRKKYKMVCAELAFAKSPSTEWSWFSNTNFIFFYLTRPGLVPTIYRTQGEPANHYATDAVPFFILFLLIFLIKISYCSSIYYLNWLARNQNNVSEWSDISTRWLLLAHLAKGNVSFYHHLAPVVRRLSSVYFSHFNLLLWNKWVIVTEDLP